MHPRRLLRTVALGLLALALLGCAADDPISVEVKVQEAATTTAPTADAAVEEDPPPPVDTVPRPAADKIIDLRGQDEIEVVIRGNQFETRFFRVDPGTKIVFVDRGVNPHNVTPSNDGAFPTIDQESLEISPQALQLDIAGDYPFYCTIHGTKTRGQTGYVIVG